MRSSCSDRVRPTPLTPAAAETLAAKLVTEMIERWRQGERLVAEDFLTRHPELWEHPGAAADLIYEELCLRQEYGPEVPVDQVLLRFPEWRPQLEVLFDCQRILGPRRSAPQFPTSGEFLGDFLLLAELGGGAHGRVFLASQLSLGDRPVVLKLTARDPLLACEVHEHLSLARLQHTHIVPLFSVQDDSTRRLRALCMPYFGGATLSQLLQALQALPPSRRTGQSLLDALDRVQADLMAHCRLQAAQLPFNLQSAIGNLQSRRALAGTSYVRAVCWIGACLADALQYAHERGLVHLDLKPSNVLLAADGQPMLLDFHLAREPIHPGGREPPWLGGTAGYMSPEQQAALQAIEQGRQVSLPVDGRSDIYSLGVVLYEALGGTAALSGGKPRPLRLSNSQVSTGLADVISKCLATDPGDRYPHAAGLAIDLRRHLAQLPLAGVRNRSVLERWRKWRRRRPHAVALAGMMVAVLTAAGAVAIGTASYFAQRLQQARTAQSAGEKALDQKEWQVAIRALEHGLYVAGGIPFQSELVNELNGQLRRAQDGEAAAFRAAAARELQQLANRIRFLYAADPFPAGDLPGLEASCRRFWENRVPIVERLNPLELDVRDDLVELAICWADLQVRLASPGGKEAAQRQALAILDEAEALFGPSPVLDDERMINGAPRREVEPGIPAPGPRPETAAATTAWRKHYALGRSFLRSGDLERAAEELERAVRCEPRELWPNFYLGLCAYRLGRYADAIAAYSVCIGLTPKPAGCFYNRALAFEALRLTEQALHDYDQALRLEPTLAVAALNRGMLHYREKRYADAVNDLQRARKLGADPAVVFFDLALVNLAHGERDAALENLRQALIHNPHQADARKLYDSLLAR